MKTKKSYSTPPKNSLENTYKDKSNDLNIDYQHQNFNHSPEIKEINNYQEETPSDSTSTL